jgi:hypothetical protein
MSTPSVSKRSLISILGEIIRALLSILLAILIVTCLTFTLLGQNSYEILRQPESYSALADQAHLAERLRGVVVSSLVNTALNNSSQSMPIDVSQIPPQTWDNIAAVILPNEWLNTSFNYLTHTLLAWLKDPKGGPLVLNLDLTTIKQTLASDKGALAIMPLLQTAPPCIAGEQPQIGQPVGH